MKAAVLSSPGSLELNDLPDPQCPRGGALIGVEACSVCGTDVKMIQRGHKDLAYPRILGHEIAGRVVEIDRECGIGEGDLVQVWPGIPCGRCWHCHLREDNRCQKIGILGFNRDGGFAETVALPQESILGGLNLIPEEGDPALAALAEPLACCINGQEMAQVSQGDSVLILGGGPIGCFHALLAERLGAEKTIVVEKLESRIREIRRHTSATVFEAAGSLEESVAEETEGRGVNVILTATPEIEVGPPLFRMLSSGGRLCIFSGPLSANRETAVDFRQIHYRELMIVGAYGCSSRHNRMAVEMLVSGEINAEWMITKRSSLDNIHDALSHSSQRKGLKSVIFA